jgi:hypothetical protein
MHFIISAIAGKATIGRFKGAYFDALVDKCIIFLEHNQDF